MNLFETNFNIPIQGHFLLQVQALTNMTRDNLNTGIAIFFAGSLMAMIIHHIILFTLYRKGKEYLYLASLCTCIMMRALSMDRNSVLLKHVFQGIDHKYFTIVEYFCVYLLMGVFPLYIQSLFPKEFPKNISRVFLCIAVIFSTITLFTPQSFYISLLSASHIIFVFEFLVVGFVLFKAFKNKKPEANVTLIAILIVFPIILNEILINSNIIPAQPFKSLLELALLIFLLFQTYILAKRNSKAYYISELLNVGLEKAINEKTQELTTSNQLKDTLLAIISHDVKSPLNALKGTLNLLNSNSLNANEITNITLQLEDQVQNTCILVDNILHWSASQNRALKIDKKQTNITPLIKECFQLFSYQASKKNIRLINEVDHNLFVLADPNIIRLVLRNLVSNALKFSNENSSINISCYDSQRNAYLVIKDQGIGMDKTSIENLFNLDKNVIRTGTKQELGTGLGLSLCKKFLEAMDSDISVESSHGKGTKFTIELPVAPITDQSSNGITSHIKVA
jgi:signal transduction histidine kinase